MKKKKIKTNSRSNENKKKIPTTTSTAATHLKLKHNQFFINLPVSFFSEYQILIFFITFSF